MEQAKLDFILGRAGSGKTFECLRAMAAKIAAAPLGPTLLLIVPEHMTYQVERALAAATASRGSMRGFVFGFRRLAWQLEQTAGRHKKPRITAIGKRLILKKIIARRGGELTAFLRAARQRGFTASLSGLIEELKNYGGTPEQLRQASEAVDSAHLSQKLRDIALLYEDFTQATQGRYEDAEDRMAALAAAIPNAPLLEGAEVWLDGFIFFNPQEQAVLRALFQKAARLHITLPLDHDVRPEKPPAEPELFYRAAKTLQLLKNMAAELGISHDVRQLGASRRFRPEAAGLAAIERRLFAFPLRREKNAAGLHLVEAATRRMEAEAAAADIVRLCRDEGRRYRDVGILLRDGDAYRQILEFTLADYGIPFFSDVKRAGVHHPLAELLRSSLEALLEGWRYDAMFRALKTGLWPMDRDETDRLENYVLEFGLRGGSSWRKEWPYAHRRQSDSPEKQAAAAAYLAEINDLRQRVAGPLSALEQAITGAESAEGRTRALYDFLTGLGVPATLDRWAKEAEAGGRLAEAKEHRMIWQAVMDLFDQFAAILSDEPVSLEEYADLLGDGLDGLEISLIPPGIDAVTVASFDQNSLGNIPALYILGANEGNMPRAHHDTGLLSESDRLLLRQAGEKVRLELSPGAAEDACGENYLLYHAFTEARSYLWISYALADTEGAGLAPSPLIGRLRSILPVTVDAIPLEGAEQRQDLLFSLPSRAVALLAPALREYREKRQREGAVWPAVYNWAREHDRPALSRLVEALFIDGQRQSDSRPLPRPLTERLYLKERRLRGSVTRFERFNACPFRHFAQYGLQLAPRAEFGFEAPDYGQLLHGLLFRFGEELRRDRCSWSGLSAEERRDRCQRLLDDLASEENAPVLASSRQYRNLRRRIGRTAQRAIDRLCDFAGASPFHPRWLEFRFGGGEDLVFPLPGNAQLEVVGQIDRLDVARLPGPEGEEDAYFLVLDYKSGTPELRLSEIYHGLQLQLLTYGLAGRHLVTSAEGGRGQLAGLLYCSLQNQVQSLDHRLTSDDARAEVEKAQRMKGWLLDEAPVLDNLDPSSRFLWLPRDKNGGLTKTSREKYAFSREKLAVLLRYARRLLIETGSGIAAGRIEAAPYRMNNSSACQFCPCKEFQCCGFDPENHFDRFRELPGKGDFIALMEQEEDSQ